MATDINAILELIHAAIKIGGDLTPIALRAYAALRNESDMTNDELIQRSRALNEEDAAKLKALIAETA